MTISPTSVPGTIHFQGFNSKLRATVRGRLDRLRHNRLRRTPRSSLVASGGKGRNHATVAMVVRTGLCLGGGGLNQALAPVPALEEQVLFVDEFDHRVVG